MKTTIHNLQQGSQAWLEMREGYDTASEAPASQGKSKYTSRTDLLKQKSTGISAEVGPAKQALFDRGHASEEAARSIAERLLDDDLYPITATTEIDGIKLLASLDGATMDRKIIWEHKLYSEKLAADVRAGNLDPHYTIQMDQQLLVTGATKCLFMTSDGTEDNMAWCWYESSTEKAEALLNGWKQFRADLFGFIPDAIEAAPVGRTPETLPALHIEVTGMVTSSNLAQYKEHALSVFASVNRDLQTDQDFADAKKAIRWAGDIEKRLQAAKEHALSQTESIDVLFKTIDDITDEARRVRLELDKIVKARDTALRAEIVAGGRESLANHLTSLNHQLGKPLMPAIQADFATAIKGMSKFDNMRDAVATELARAKIAANEMAERISFNMRILDAHPDLSYLFNDQASIALKHSEDLQMLVKVRISEHQAKEAARIEAETARIAAQERARADAEIAAANAKAESELAAKVSAQLQAQDEIAAKWASVAAIAKAQVEQPIQAEQDVQVEQNIALEHPTLKLGQIADRLGFALTADFLKSIGFEPAATDKGAKLFHENDFPRMCAVLVRHIQKVAAGVSACTA